MKTTRTHPALTASRCLLALALCAASCSRPVAPGRTGTSLQVLSSDEAAQLAAKLANDECERLYKRRPFTAGQQRAILQDATYHWGSLDEGGPGGYSAQVTFAPDGTHPKVDVYFSTDRLEPARKLPPAPRAISRP